MWGFIRNGCVPVYGKGFACCNPRVDISTNERGDNWVVDWYCIYWLHPPSLFVIIWWIENNASDMKSLIILNLAILFIADVMSIITTFQNRDYIESSHMKIYIICMWCLNWSWFIAWWVVTKDEQDGFFRANEDNLVVVNNQGQVVDGRSVNENVINKINYLFYQPYYKLRNKTWSICIIEYEINEIVSVLPVWHHTFHQECISEWLKRNSTWPFWRRHLSIHDVEVEQDNNMDHIVGLVQKETLK